jgi:S-adenosyl-L-methionine hydrolase (adenosine-forming)
MSIITLLTDYGLKDSYVAEVKGAILRIKADVTIIDITHDIGNYDVEEGAFHLARSVSFFPEGTIHVAVVDPGVGGERKPIIIKSSGATFVGPDNGLLAPAAERLGVEEIYEITNRDLLPSRVSDVFDGRDLFGPTAALLAKGFKPEELGEVVSEYVRLPQYELKHVGSRIEARIIHVDGFGNLVTNITGKHLDQMGLTPGDFFSVDLRGQSFRVPYVRRFSSVPRNELLMLVAGGDYLELSVNQGSAKERLGVGKGEKISLARLL